MQYTALWIWMYRVYEMNISHEDKKKVACFMYVVDKLGFNDKR